MIDWPPMDGWASQPNEPFEMFVDETLVMVISSGGV